VSDEPKAFTFLFTDIEGSTRLWEQQPEAMRPALARHDAITKAAVIEHRGSIVKTTGDGVHAVFDDAADAIAAALQLQRTLADPAATQGVALQVRCGLHRGVDERRDNDFYGRAVNRAARIMSAAHGGQVLLSQAVAEQVRDRLPDGATLRDLGSVRLRDLTSPERLHQLVHAQLRRDFPALRSLEATPNNLAQQLNSFVGRERELHDVKQLLAASRLVTLCGVGGIGKTRLSVQLAADVIDDYPDGVWFVDLAPLTDVQLVPQALASVLGVKEEAGRPVIEALLKFVRERQLLVILDNCEHMIEACAELAKQLLQAGAHLKVIASSREALRLTGETLYHVPALSAPAPTKKIALDVLTHHDAVRLFVDRATAAQPAFRVTRRSAAAMVEICHRLDGIPLAIELAAARTRALSVDAIATRINDRFRLLGGADRTHRPRQQTLRALIDWSYDLLTEQERALFRRLAVFAGGWTIEAAEAVGAGGDIDAGDVIDLLMRLVEKSLVVMDAEGGRYRLLDTVRQYAQERLDEAGEAFSTRTRHLDHYLAIAEQARPELDRRDQGAWLARLDLEGENLLATHSWCDQARDGAALGLRLIFALRPYWLSRGLLTLGHQVTVEALARSGAHERNLARLRGLFDAGQICYFMGRYAEAQRYLEESLGIARELGDTSWVASTLQPLGMVCLGEGHLSEARDHLEEALALARELGDKRELAAASNALAQLHRMQGRLDAAESLYQDVVSLARQLQDQESTAIGLLNLAMVAVERASTADARTMLLEVLTIADDIGSKPAQQSAMEVCASLAAISADWEHAALYYGVAEAQTAQTGLQRDPADAAFLAPFIEQAKQALGPQAFSAGEDAGRRLPADEALARARAWLLALA
jgi:predicted ATPase/class 3 adenylate cyclase